MKYNVAVDGRIFRVVDDKETALSLLKDLSLFYPNKQCALVNKNGSKIKNTPFYLDGHEITHMNH